LLLLLVGFGLGLGLDTVLVVCVWVVCVCDVCVLVCVWVDAAVDVDDELELDDEDGFLAFFFGSLLSVGSAAAEPAPVVTDAAATSTLLGAASFAAGADDGFFVSLPDALLTPNATTKAARAAATAIPI
jgi:hypothetical protein